VNECAFYHASVPSAADWNDLMHRGIPNGTDAWIWSSAPMIWANNAMVRFGDARPSKYFSFDGSASGQSDPMAHRSVRCIGMADQSKAILPNPTCNGGCYTTTNRAAPLKADQTDRPAATWTTAMATCRANGGELPKFGDFAELVHSGWPNGVNTSLWMADALYDASGPTLSVPSGRWLGAGNVAWTISGNGGGAAATTASLSYRCVYRSKQGALPVCSSSELIQQQANGSYQCIPKVNGSSSGQGNGSEFVDALGNAWDGAQRGAASWSTASDTCQALGGRLPTPTEIYAVRANQSDRPSLGTASSLEGLWTKTPAYLSGNRVLTSVAAGEMNHSPESNPHPYRCIWPSTRSNVLSGAQCLGPAASGQCFRIGDDFIFDAQNRAPQFAATAIETCLESGGSLLDTRDFAQMIHGGAPGGVNDQYLWLADFTNNGNSGHAIGQWSGTGTTAWRYDTPFAGAGHYQSSYAVRCGYTTRLR
jgi:hypothetical protein